MPPHPAKTLPVKIQKLAVIKNFNKDMVLHYQAKIFDYIYLLQSGRAFAVAHDADGNETWINEYKVGQFIGIESLSNPEPSPYEIITKTALSCLLFPRHNFIELLSNHPELNHMVMTDMANQLAQFTTQTLETHSLSIKGRIAAEFVRKATPMGKTPDTYIIRPTPIFVELAQRLGTQRETVSRAVNQMIKQNILKRHTGALLIPCLHTLKAEIK